MNSNEVSPLAAGLEDLRHKLAIDSSSATTAWGLRVLVERLLEAETANPGVRPLGAVFVELHEKLAAAEARADAAQEKASEELDANIERFLADERESLAKHFEARKDFAPGIGSRIAKIIRGIR